jgi:DNA-binding winged helix-turn-helix (wHTH) protein
MNPQVAEVQEPRPNPPRIVRFGLFEADLRSSDLLKQGRRLKLQTQPFQILAILLERPGEIVSREELCRRLWPEDTFVDFDHSLNTAVRRLREVLADSPENPIFIETLQRRGYRFIAPVVNVDQSPSEELAQDGKAASNVLAITPNGGLSELPVAIPAPVIQFRFVVLVGVVGLLVGAFLASGIAYFALRSNDPAVHVRPDQVRSLAVLPLENLSVTPDQEFLADGMTDELIASLAKVKHLRVVPRTSSMAYSQESSVFDELPTCAPPPINALITSSCAAGFSDTFEMAAR